MVHPFFSSLSARFVTLVVVRRQAQQRSITAMRLTIRSGSPVAEQCDALVVLVASDKELTGAAGAVDAAAGGALGAVIALGDFDGAAKSRRLVHVGSGLGTRRALLVGTGTPDDDPAEAGRLAGGAAIQGLAGTAIRSALVVVPEQTDARFLQGFTEGLALAGYRFDQYRQPAEKETAVEAVTLLTASDGQARALGAAFDRGLIFSDATRLSRDLVNEPPNQLTPTVLAERAIALAGERGMDSQVLGPAELTEQGFGALLGVARGSTEEPRFIILEHAGDDAEAAPLVLVGKGLTFDSGGLSLKTAKGMEDMKIDMGGAAAVLGAMQAISRLDCRQRVVALIPATENMTGPSAQRPGDVVRSFGGVSIEVLNTDAEGRLVLADALGYAARYQPAAVVDAATLTGSAIVALGHHAAGLLGTDEPLMSAVEAAAAATGERVWRLPLWEVYEQPLKSKVADIKNIGDGGAGTILGAAFLKRFVSYPWAHLDIAGTAWDVKDVSYQPSRATGYGARLFAELATAWGAGSERN